MKRRHIPESARRRKLRHRYGLTTEEYERKLEEQHGSCAICKETKPYKLYVDHNHSNGQIRDLLCARCNTIAGALEDERKDLVLLYLEKHDDNRT
jgi:hypothetical protein